VPALVYLGITGALDAGGPGSAGWGIPVATDIAFAVGILALLGSRVPSNLQLFVLALAIVDDIGAIAVIAIAYTEQIDLLALAIAVTAVAAAVALRVAKVSWPPVYVALGLICWLATYNSGIHATLAGVAFGLLAPARPLAPSEVARSWADDLSDEPSAAEMRELTTMAKETVSVAERVQHVLHPMVSFVVVPVFALANAGVRVSGDALSTPAAQAVAGGVAGGLLIGKIVGITGACALAIRWGLARLPDGVSWSHMVGAAGLAAIGFTISLFVTGLAFDDPDLQDASRLAIHAVSAIAALFGTTVLRRAASVPPSATGTAAEQQ
jgi:NhaA family Na+:H+ antiporter